MDMSHGLEIPGSLVRYLNYITFRPKVMVSY